MTKQMVDIIDLNGNKIAEIRAAACGVEVANKMKREGVSNCSYQFSTYKTADGVTRNCWKPARNKSLATLISITHNQ